jgi:hypothetical protein
MRRFVGRATLFLLIAGPLVALLWSLSRRYPDSYDDVRSVSRLEAVLANRSTLRALSVGNSHARAVDFEVLGVPGLDIGLPWNDVFEVEYQLRTLAPRLPELEVVFIALSYFTFHWANTDAGEAERFLQSRRLFYAMVPTARWMPGDWDNYAAGRVYWLARSDVWYNVAMGLAGRDPYYSRAAEYEEDRTEANTPEELVLHARARVPEKVDLARRMLAADTLLAERTYASLSASIRFLQERGVRVVLFTPPYYRAYSDLYVATGLVGDMRRRARRLAAEHGVPWLDLSQEPALAADAALFRDSDHLNYRGKEAFTPRLRERLRADGSHLDANDHRNDH